MYIEIEHEQRSHHKSGKKNQNKKKSKPIVKWNLRGKIYWPLKWLRGGSWNLLKIIKCFRPKILNLISEKRGSFYFSQNSPFPFLIPKIAKNYQNSILWKLTRDVIETQDCWSSLTNLPNQYRNQIQQTQGQNQSNRYHYVT